MNNNNYTSGAISGIIVSCIIMIFIWFVYTTITEVRDVAKSEQLTIIYKNNTISNIDKNIAVNIAKQYFPTSNWTNIENKAAKNYIEFNAWSIKKK